jgi:hypothetical protein
MSDSQFPKNSKLGRLKGWLGLMGTLFAIITGAYTGVMTLWGNVTTDTELLAHNDNPISHSALRNQIDDLRERVELCGKRVDEEHSATVELGARLVRIDSADRERKHELKAAAATYYETEYRRLIRRGTPVFDAVLEAMRSPWYDRPNSR